MAMKCKHAAVHAIAITLCILSTFSVAKAASPGGLSELGVKDAVSLLCKRQITAVEYAKALIDQAHEIRCLNTYAELQADQVLAEAKAIDGRAARGEEVGPLCGLALPVKDNIDVSGYATVAGTPALEGNIVQKSAAFIERFRAAGGIVLGKARLHELAAGYTTISSKYGPTLNPHNVETHPGGSSGGNAAMIAARGAAAGFCSDTGGSCRIPASLTGVVGFRPTTTDANRRHCYRAGSGLVPLSVTRDTIGLMARSVEDVEFLDRTLNNCSRPRKDVQLEGLRVGYPREWWHDTGDEIKETLSKALRSLSAAGVELVEFDISLMLEEQRRTAPDKFHYIYEFPRELSRYLYDHKLNISLPHLVDQMTSPMAQQALSDWAFRDSDSWPSPADFVHMLTVGTPKITQLWHDYFDNLGFDVMLAPSTPITARPINASEPYSEVNGRLEPTMVVNARLYEVDGPSEVPGLSIPIGLASNGLPVGLHLHARPGDDGTLLSIGKSMEAVFDSIPAPPQKPLCFGLKAIVTHREPEQNVPDPTDVKSAQRAAERLSIYDFKLVPDLERSRLGLGSHDTMSYNELR